MTRTYRGNHTDRIVTVQDGDEIWTLPPRLDLRNHSPDGFNWGYGGSGPSQLALALLADALDDGAAALRLYQNFKMEFIASLDPLGNWEMTSDQIKEWCNV